MTERDYIICTNLAKARIASRTVRDILPGLDGVVDEEALRAVLTVLHEWEDGLSKLVDD